MYTHDVSIHEHCVCVCACACAQKLLQENSIARTDRISVRQQLQKTAELVGLRLPAEKDTHPTVDSGVKDRNSSKK